MAPFPLAGSRRRRITVAIAIAILLASIVAFGASAQDSGGAPVRVRVSLKGNNSDRSRVGTLIARNDSVVVVRLENGNDMLVIPRDNVREIEVSSGRSSRGTSAMRGLLIGAGAGVALGLITGEDCSKPNAPIVCIGRADGALIAGAALGAVGGLIGLAVGGHERWSKLSPDVHLGMNTPGGAGLAFSVAFR